MIKEAFETLIALLINGSKEPVIPFRDGVRQSGSYLLFSALKREKETVKLYFKLFIAGHSLIGDAEALTTRLEYFLNLIEAKKANPLKNHPSKLMVEEVSLKEVNSLFFYEAGLCLEVRI